MPILKSSLIKPSKSMLFFHIWNANFSVTPINSQMYMTKPKQVQKKLSENTGKTLCPLLHAGGGHIYGNYCTCLVLAFLVLIRSINFHLILALLVLNHLCDESLALTRSRLSTCLRQGGSGWNSLLAKRGKGLWCNCWWRSQWQWKWWWWWNLAGWSSLPLPWQSWSWSWRP